MLRAHSRFLFFLAFIACASILGAAVYLQYAFSLVPCVLCWLQRALMSVCAVICLIAALQGPGTTGRRRYSALFLLAALAGGVAAGGQVWLQTASMDALVLITASLEQILYALPLFAQIDQLFMKVQLCAQINWSLFGISLPEWSLLAFSALSLFALWPLCSGWRRPSSVED